MTSDAFPGTEPTHTGNTRLFTSIDYGTGYSHSAGDSSDENHATGTDGTLFLPHVFSIPESSTVHVTVPSAPIVSSVGVSIPLEYLTSSVNFQSTNPAYYSNAPSYQQVSIPQRNYGYHGYGNFIMELDTADLLGLKVPGFQARIVLSRTLIMFCEHFTNCPHRCRN